MNLVSTAAGAAVGMAVGAAAMYVAAQDSRDHRQVRKTVHKMAKGAEQAILDLDRMMERYTK